MKFTRVLTTAKPDDVSVVDWIRWKTVDVLVSGKDGEVIFEQAGVEVPEQWSQNAANILASKYFRKAGVPSEEDLRPLEERGIPGFLLRRFPASHNRLGGETSARQVFHRLAGCWAYWGWREGYFSSEEDALIFYDETYACLALQVAAPASPQWFNTGLWWAYGIEGPDSGMWRVSDYPVDDEYKSRAPVRVYNSYEYPQPHACFLSSVSDDLVNEGGIMDLWVREARIFKHGSGSGINPSRLRAKGEPLSGGGYASGLMSWLEIGDRAAGSVHSGGTTRRAAKMVCLDADHPEVEDFVNWKMREEAKAAAMCVGSRIMREDALRILMSTGEDKVGTFIFATSTPSAMLDRARAGIIPDELSIDWEGEAIRTVSGQNSNNSVRVTDDFMRRVDENGVWYLFNRTDQTVNKTVQATGLWDQMCRAAWACADPGLIFHDTVNSWNTCAADGEIRTTNPCFVGGTFVDTSEGFVDVAELVRMSDEGESLPWAFCFDRDAALPDLRPIKRAWCSGYVRRLAQVTTKRGQVLYCTPEHEWLTRRGDGYVAAADLAPGTSLQKINREINYQRKDRVALTHRRTGDERRGRSSQHRFIWEKMRGPIPDGYELHHVNEDPTDDRYSNFELKLKGVHQSEHSSGVNNPRFLRVGDEDLVEVYDAAANYLRKTYKEVSGVNPSLWNKFVREKGLTGVVPLANSRGIQGVSWSDFVERMDSVRKAVNDSVLSVRLIELPEAVPVYDVEVEGCHNFGVRSDATRNGDSLIVHNCAEFQHLDGSACNLASLRLTAFLREDGTVDLDLYQHTCRLWTAVLDISNSMASFPAKEFAVGSYNYRTVGLGYADLGGLLMRMAIPYASDDGRALAAGLTALMTGVAYLTSAEMARELGPFPRWLANSESMWRVLNNHRVALFPEPSFDGLNVEPSGIGAFQMDKSLRAAALSVWNKVCLHGQPFRNAQVTNIAPTGTISFVMDCDTTGIEPDFALVKHKSLAGGGSMRIVNQAVAPALRRLGYKESNISEMMEWISCKGSLDKYDESSLTHQVLYCANDIDPDDHVRMVAAVQPFLSGGVSKTINMSRESTVENVSRVFKLAYRLGLKAVALYRDGSKLSQPMRAAGDARGDSETTSATARAADMTTALEKLDNGLNVDAYESFRAARSRNDTEIVQMGTATTAVPLSDEAFDKLKKRQEAFSQANEAQVGSGKIPPMRTTVTVPEVAELFPDGVIPMPEALLRGEREYLPWRRTRGFTQKVKIGQDGQSVYLRVSEYPDGRPGEVFLELAHEGSTLRALANCLAISISVGLQRGVPVAEYVDQFVGTKFEPAGYVEGHDRIRFASSIADYIGRELGINYAGRDDLANSPMPIAEAVERIAEASQVADEQQRGYLRDQIVAYMSVEEKRHNQAAANLSSKWQPTGDYCPSCGELLRRNGTCRSCPNCGYDEGCSG